MKKHEWLYSALHVPWAPGHQNHRETGLAIGFWSNMSVTVHLSSW